MQRESTLARAGRTGWQIIGLALAIALAGWSAGRLMPVLLPVGVAVLLTALLRPVHDALRGAGLPGAVAALLTLGGLVLVLALIIYLVVPPFAERLGELGSSIDGGLHRLAYSVGRDLAGMDHAAVDRALQHASSSLRQHLGGLAGDALTGATAIAGGLATAVLVVFLSFFLLKDGDRLWAWLVDLAPARRRSSLRGFGRDAWAVLGTYARGVVFVATVDAVFIGLALVIVGVPLAMPLIVLTWIAAFFPIVGAVTAGAAAVLVALVAKGIGSALIVLAAIIVVQQLEGNVLYPVVVGPRLRLHPIVVLLAVAVGGTVAGLPGAFLAVPIATVAAVALDRARPDDRAEPAAARRAA